MMKEIKINKKIFLLDFLINDLKYSKSKAKSLLEHKSIYINNEVVSKYNYELNVGDIFCINKELSKANNITGLKIIYEDDNFLVVDKPSGLLAISTEKEKNKTAYHILREYLNNKKEKLFVLHRIDKDTSGILVFVKSQNLKDSLQAKWNEIVLKRGYYALVEGEFKDKTLHIENYLKENKEGIVYVTSSSDKDAKKAITDIKLIKTNGKYSLLDIDIKTGRKNQIRATLKSIGYPIVGDRKYGSNKTNNFKLGLCAYALEFKNPIDNKKYLFSIDIPSRYKI